MNEALGSTQETDTRRLRWAILLVGALVRVGIAIVGIGTNDSLLWHRFGREICTWPFADIWRDDPWSNNPPLPMLYAGLAYAIVGDRLYLFSLLWKMPSLAAELVTIALVIRLVQARTSSARAGLIAGLAYALNPTALLVSAYHGNIDAVLAMLTLLAWHAAAGGRFGWAGLAAGAAINVKLSAGPAAVLLLACTRSRTEFLRAAGAMAVMSLPFAITIALVGRPFFEQTLFYRPPNALWLPAVFSQLRGVWPGLTPVMMWFASAHAATLLQCTVLLIVLVAWWQRRRARDGVDLLVVAAFFWCALMFWMGGAFQYTIWPLPLLALVRPRIALLYGVAAGIWLAWSYYDACVNRWPFQSLFFVTTTGWSHLALVLPLAALAIAMVSLARSRQDSPTRIARAGTLPPARHTGGISR